MKKVLFLMVLAFLVISAFSFVSATTLETIIGGRVFNANDNSSISGANVTAICGATTLNTNTNNNGLYIVIFQKSNCTNGNSLNVTATNSGLTGSKIGIVNATAISYWDVELDFDIPLIPEFGIIAGAIAVIGAVGIFFFVRKK